MPRLSVALLGRDHQVRFSGRHRKARQNAGQGHVLKLSLVIVCSRIAARETHACRGRKGGWSATLTALLMQFVTLLLLCILLVVTRDLGDALAIVTWTTRGARIALSGVAISAEAGSCSRLAVCFGGVTGKQATHSCLVLKSEIKDSLPGDESAVSLVEFVSFFLAYAK